MPVPTPSRTPLTDATAPREATAPPEATPPESDVIETIVPSGDAQKADTTTPPFPATAAPHDADRTDIGGWARESSEWTLTTSGYRKGAPSPLDVPHDRLISRTQLYLHASHVRGDWFEATVSGVVGYSLREQGPSGAASFDGVNGQATSGEAEISLRELYLGLYSRHVDFRIGQQRVAWGRADLQSPNDVLNARDLRDPILTETELRHIPTPLLRLDIDLGSVNVELAVTPVFIPDLYDVYGTNWSAIQQDSSPEIKQQFASAWQLVDATKQSQFNALAHDTGLPAANWTAPSGGTKLSTTLGGIDLDAYYHYGFDTTPYVLIAPTGPSLAMALLGVPISATYVRRHHVGLDATGTAGPLVFRLDAAYESERVYYHVLFSSFESPTALGVASVEYQTGDIDKVLLVEAIYNHLFNPPDLPLLGYERDSYAVAATFRWPIGAGFAVDLRSLVGITPTSFVLQPAFRWKLSDALFLKVGTVLLGGEEDSVGWYYRHNTSAFVQAKYSF